MKSNNHITLHPVPDCNPITKFCGYLVSNVILATQLSEYLKPMKLTILMVLGNVEDEKTFSITNFMKLKFHNNMIVHLDLVVRMFTQ
jgi:hypothetical protein